MGSIHKALLLHSKVGKTLVPLHEFKLTSYFFHRTPFLFERQTVVLKIWVFGRHLEENEVSFVTSRKASENICCQ